MPRGADDRATRGERLPLVLMLGSAAVLAVLSAIAVRYGQSLSVDEPFVANTVRRTWADLAATFRGDNIPLYYVLLRGWTWLFGESEFALRSLSIGAYAGAVVATGLAAVRCGGVPAAGLAAALVATSVRIGLVHAATARPYALLCLWVAVFLALAASLLTESAGSVRRRVGYGVALTAVHLCGLFTHPTYVFVVLAAIATARLVAEPGRWTMALSATLALGIYLIVWWPVVQATFAAQGTSWMQGPKANDLLDGYLLMWGTGRGAMMLGAALALLLGVPRETRAFAERVDLRWMLAFTVALWVLPFAASFWQPIFLATRTPVLLLPATALALGVSVGRPGGWRVSAAFCVVLIAAVVGAVLTGLRQSDLAPTRASIATLASRATCEDTIVAPGLSDAGVESYLRRVRADPCLRVEHFPASMRNLTLRIADPLERTRLDDESRAAVQSLAVGPGTVWLLVARRGLGHEVSEMLERDLRRVRQCDALPASSGSYFDEVLSCRAP